MPTEIPALLDDLLDNHHAFLRKEMDRLDAAMVDAPRQIRAPFAHFRRSMIEHMDHEEKVVFPAIRALASGQSTPAGLPELHAERDAIGTFELSLREAARDAGPFETDILRMLDDLAEHVRKEDEELLPAVRALQARAPAPEAPRSTQRSAPPPRPRGVWGLAHRVWEKARRR